MSQHVSQPKIPQPASPSLVFRLPARLKGAGWTLERVNGSHHIFSKDGRAVLVPVHGNRERRWTEVKVGEDRAGCGLDLVRRVPGDP